ncbi:MAG: hypothetical protein P8Y22_07280, partial [Sulfurimonas sp.]
MDTNSTIAMFIENNHLGDYSSIIGLLITLIGFTFTLYQLYKTKQASEVATEAVKAMRRDLNKVDVIANLSSVLTEMEEIKR